MKCNGYSNQWSTSLCHCTYHDTIIGNSGVRNKCVNVNQDSPVMIPITEPTITWFHVWYCKYVLLIHTSAVKNQQDTRTNNRPARSNGSNVLFVCSLQCANPSVNCVDENISSFKFYRIYLMKMNSVTYVEKNHMNCEWLDGIPYSEPMWTRLTGRGSLIQCFNIILLNSFTSVPIKNAICKLNNVLSLVISDNKLLTIKAIRTSCAYCV